MPFSDYNKVKKISPTSQNDSGSTIQKAQPLLITGEEQVKEQDGFEDGDFTSNPSWTVTENGGGTETVQTGTVKNGSNAVELSIGDGDGASVLSHDRGANDTVEDGDVYEAWVRVTDADSSAYLEVSNGNSFVPNIDDSAFAGVENNSFIVGSDSSTTTFGISADNTWYKIRLKLYPTSGTVKAVIEDTNGEVVASETESTSTSTNRQYVNLYAKENASGVSAYFDDVSYSTTTVSSTTESTTGTGNIVLDWTNISDAQDVAVYDQDGNLLDYEIESLDTTAETGVLWAYNSWVRDDSVQAQVAYGSNSANTDRQNIQGTWNNSGQNAVMVQHLQDDPLTATDSTANNNDGTVNGAVSTSGQFDGAASFDGTDDEILIPNSDSLSAPNEITLAGWINMQEIDVGGTNGPGGFVHKWDTTGVGQEWGLDTGDGDTIRFLLQDTNGNNYIVSAGAGYLNANEWVHGVGVWDGSNLQVYGDAILQDSASASISISDTNEDLRIGANVGNLVSDIPLFNDAIRVFEDGKSADWIQSDYDASPKAGQVFFSQQAAETTVQTETAAFDQTVSVESRDVTKQFSQDLILENANIPEQFNQDVAVKDRDVTQGLDTDVAIRDKDVEMTFTQDATLLDRDAEKTFSQTVSLELEDQQETFSQDIILSSGNIETFNQDVFLENRDVTKQFSQDLILENANIPEQFNQDVAVKDRDVEATFSTSLLVADKDNEETLTQDVYVSMRMTESFSNSVVIAQQPAPNTKNPLSAKVTKPSRTFAKVLKPSSTYVEVKEVNEP